MQINSTLHCLAIELKKRLLLIKPSSFDWCTGVKTVLSNQK